MINKLFKRLSSALLIISMVLLSSNLAFAAPPVALATVLTVPTSLVATAGDSQISLTWSSVKGAAYYNVYESLDDITYNLISVTATVITSTYDVTELTNGKLHYFKTTAVNTASESPCSNVVGETPSVRPLK